MITKYCILLLYCFIQVPIANAQTVLLIDKSEYSLTVVKNCDTIKQYSVVFGGNPVDDKSRQGDKCTPEGTFGIRSKYIHKKWSRFIWIDYPNEDSWKKFNQAKSQKKIPSNAKIGGEIGIHGVPKGYEYAIKHRMNWTLGCISMTTHDICEVYDYVDSSTQVIITP